MRHVVQPQTEVITPPGSDIDTGMPSLVLDLSGIHIWYSPVP